MKTLLFRVCVCACGALRQSYCPELPIGLVVYLLRFFRVSSVQTISIAKH